MISKEHSYFTSRDLRVIKKLNPFILGIGGHSVVPHGELVRGPDKLAFITQLRDPIDRTISQYRFRINRLKRKADIRAFLEHPVSRNFQVRKIAGCESIELAKENILRQFLLVGPVEKFDSFLVLLAKKLKLPLRLFTYSKQNIGANREHVAIPAGFCDQLREQNQLDQQLVEWVNKELFPTYVASYGDRFSTDLAVFADLQKSHKLDRTRSAINFVYRNAYIKPVSGVIRVINGMPYFGSYST